MSMNLVTMLYLIASVCFIQALKGLSHPSTARRGNAFGMAGMALAVATTIALIVKLKTESSGAGLGYGLVVLGVCAGKKAIKYGVTLSWADHAYRRVLDQYLN